MQKRILFSLFSFFLFSLILCAQDHYEQSFNCYSVLVGKDASTNGAVMFAHNEDDWGTRIVNWIKVPAKEHEAGEMITLKNGAQVQQVVKTNSYMWLEMPEMDFSDTYMNEYGVTISSDACQSREDEPEMTGGGIGYWLRRLMAERSASARDAVLIGGKLVEEYGYTGSGRSYCIADTKEAWVMAVVNGKHWVAQRVPDNHVVVIPNYYTIGTINLYDSNNFMACHDLVDYAKERGWYDPSSDGAFNFKKAYGKKGSLEHPGNIDRMWQGVNFFSFKQYDLTDEFPFSFLPHDKVSIFELFELLRNHYEGNDLDLTHGYVDGNPHLSEVSTICSETTQYGFVALLREYMPVEVGAILWVAPFRPCVHPFIPFYCGITEMPSGYYREDPELTLQQHFSIPDDIYDHKEDLAFWAFVENMNYIDSDYLNLYKKPQKKSISFEQKTIKKLANSESDLIFNYKNDPEKLKEILTERVNEIAEKAWKLVNTQ